MNCLKCFIAEDCEVPRMVISSDNTYGLIIPTKITPFNEDECPILKLLVKSEEVSSK